MWSPGKCIYKLLNAFCENSTVTLRNQCEKLEHPCEKYYGVNTLTRLLFLTMKFIENISEVSIKITFAPENKNYTANQFED